MRVNPGPEPEINAFLKRSNISNWNNFVYTLRADISSKIIRFEKMTLDGCSKNGSFRVRESTKTMYARAPRT